MKHLVKRIDPVSYLGPEERWRMLGVAIVKQAVLDWKESSIRLAHPETATKEMSEQKRSAEHFLSSDDCELYSGLDGRTMLRKMKAGII